MENVNTCQVETSDSDSVEMENVHTCQVETFFIDRLEAIPNCPPAAPHKSSNLSMQCNDKKIKKWEVDRKFHT